MTQIKNWTVKTEAVEAEVILLFVSGVGQTLKAAVVLTVVA